MGSSGCINRSLQRSSRNTYTGHSHHWEWAMQAQEGKMLKCSNTKNLIERPLHPSLQNPDSIRRWGGWCEGCCSERGHHTSLLSEGDASIARIPIRRGRRARVKIDIPIIKEGDAAKGGQAHLGEGSGLPSNDILDQVQNSGLRKNNDEVLWTKAKLDGRESSKRLARWRTKALRSSTKGARKKWKKETK